MRNWMKQLVKRSFRGVGLTLARRDHLAELIPGDYVQSPYLPRVYRQSLARILYFKEMLDRVAPIPGDVVECGVSIGHGLLYFLLLGELMERERDVYGFDSFAGFPESTPQDTKADGSHQVSRGDYATPKQLVRRVLEDGRAARSSIEHRVHLLQGFFENTLPQYHGTIALLHLDCDLYESYQTCLRHLYGKVAAGGLILFDEYADPNFPGARKAVDEFFAGKPERVQEFPRYDYRKCFVVKC
jgi:hypothetical protein